MDNTLRVWDIRPFAPEQRCVKIFQGHSHNFEKNLLRCAWSPDGSRVSCGSADRFVYVWDSMSRRLLYKLPGHNSSVNQTDFHPVENISKLNWNRICWGEWGIPNAAKLEKNLNNLNIWLKLGSIVEDS